MPLEHGKSKKSFEHNIKAEMNAGKPMKQSLAIAYAMKKRGKKMNKGGDVDPTGGPTFPADEREEQRYAKEHGSIIPYSSEYDEQAKIDSMADKSQKTMREHEKMRSKKYAKGGQITDNYQSSSAYPGVDGDLEDEAHYMAQMKSGFVGHEGDHKRPNHTAIEEDGRGLGQHGSKEQEPYSGEQGFHDEDYMGNPGNEHDMYSDTEDDDGMDMVGRIMKQRQEHYSMGGKVANGGEDKLKDMADGDPNNFDDLPLKDDLKFSYTGKNSGDEDDDMQEDHDRKDIVARIMKSRAKKDRMPSPA